MLGGASETCVRSPRDDAAEFFETHLTRFVGKVLLQDYRSLNCRFDVQLTGAVATVYRIAVVHGTLAAAIDAAGRPEVTYVLDARTLLEVVTAISTPQDAFYDLRIEIEGAMELGLELGAVFEDFFRFHPYRIPES